MISGRPEEGGQIRTIPPTTPQDREATGVRTRTPRSAWGGGGSEGGRGGGRHHPPAPPPPPPPPAPTTHTCRSSLCSRSTTATTKSTTGTTSGTTATTSEVAKDRGRRAKRATVNINIVTGREAAGTHKTSSASSGGNAGDAGRSADAGISASTRRVTKQQLIRVVRYSSKSAGKSLERAPSPSSDVKRPVRRHIRIHIVTDKERALNKKADNLSSDVRVPRAWQPTQTLTKAQRQNRTQERHLAEKLGDLDKDLADKFNKITKSERRLLNEFLGKYPDMYDHVTSGMRGDRATWRRIGVFPPPNAARDGSFRRLTEAAVQEAEAAIIRAQLRTPGGGQFPPLVKRKVHITAMTAADSLQPPPSPRRKYRPPHATARSKSTSGAMQLEGVRCEEKRPTPDTPGKAEIELNSNNKGSNAPESEVSGMDVSRTPSFIRTPGKGASTARPPAPPPDQHNVNVSVFVDTDFGFHPERMRATISGMSLQKDIQDTSQLERDMEKVARKHIDAAMTSGLNARSSRKVEGVSNLRAVIVGGRKKRLPVSPETDEISLTGSGRSSSMTARVVLSPRKATLKSGGPLPPLDKDLSKVSVVGKSDGPLVSEVNSVLALNNYVD